MFSALALAIAVVIGIRGVELNVRALGVILLVETGVLVLFDIVSIARHGLDVLPAQSFSPSEVMSGSPGLALLFAVTCFIGFEATAIFGEERATRTAPCPRPPTWRSA